MTHPKFGNKFTCWSCASKFYDMKKADAKCPKCGSSPKDDPALKAAEKGSKKGGKEEAMGDEDMEEESFEADMDELVNDEEEGDDEGDLEELGGDDEE